MNLNPFFGHDLQQILLDPRHPTTTLLVAAAVFVGIALEILTTAS
jgi:hypothetical protein